jgi:hypothetical protein
VEAGVALPDTAHYYLSASSVTRTRQAHQITACSLYKLKKKAYHDYHFEESSIPGITFEDWCEK